MRFLLLLLFALAACVQGGLRNNYCKQRDAIANQTLSVAFALKGSRPAIAYTANAASAYFQIDPNTMLPVNGFLFNLFERIAISGGFRWNYTLTPNQSPSVKDDIYLTNITNLFETVTKVSFDTTQRRKAGMDFTPPLLRADLVMIVDNSLGEKVTNFDDLAFLFPFDYNLWGLIVLAILVQVVIQYIIDFTEFRRARIKTLKKQIDDPNYEGDLKHHAPYPIEEYFYQMFGTYTTISAYAPVKRSTQASYLLFSFFITILLTSYLAILATQLSGTPRFVLPIASMYEANEQGATVCFRKGGASIAFTTQLYPNIKVVQTEKVSNNQVLDYLNDGKCQAAVLAYNDWQIVSTSINNQGCNLVLSGPVVRQMNVALPFKVDLTDRCSSTFGQTFSELITLMNEQFVIQQIWTDTISRSRTVDCANRPVVVVPTPSLGFETMHGIFYFYFIVAGMILVLHITSVSVASYNETRLLRLKREGKETLTQSIKKRVSMVVLQKTPSEMEDPQSVSSEEAAQKEKAAAFEKKRDAIIRSCGRILLEVTNEAQSPESLLLAMSEASHVDELLTEVRQDKEDNK